MTTKADLLKAIKNRKKQLKAITLAGVECFIKPLTVGEMNKRHETLQQLRLKKAKQQGIEIDESKNLEEQLAGIEPGNMFAYSLASVVCDEKGQLLFDPDNEADLAVINDMTAEDIDDFTRAISEQGVGVKN